MGPGTQNHRTRAEPGRISPLSGEQANVVPSLQIPEKRALRPTAQPDTHYQALIAHIWACLKSVYAPFTARRWRPHCRMVFKVNV